MLAVLLIVLVTACAHVCLDFRHDSYAEHFLSDAVVATSAATTASGKKFAAAAEVAETAESSCIPASSRGTLFYSWHHFALALRQDHM